MTQSVLILNNYSGTGIGDFGLQLARYASEWGFATSYLETNPDDKGYLDQLVRLFRFRGTLVANLGLTSWGRSGTRNLLAFGILGARSFRGRETVVLLHNIIDIMEADKTGYRINGLTRLGARIAVWLLRRGRVVVFSKRVGRILERSYGISPSLVHPIPCVTDAADATHRPSSHVVVNAGSIAPYKGVELFAQAARMTKSEGRWVLLARTHRVLESDPNYTLYMKQVIRDCYDAGIEVRGGVPDSEFRLALRQATVGVLCYTSTGGASASFAAMASAGLPVVATNVPELLEVAQLGGGVVIVPPSAQKIADSVDRLCDDEPTRMRMTHEQLTYAQKYSWGTFMSLLAPLIEGFHV